MVVSNEEYHRLASEEKAAVRKDRAEHKRLHPLKLVAFQKLGRRPENVRERRKLLLDGEAYMAQASDLANAVAGAEMILKAYFARSYDIAAELGYWTKHPDFPGYVAQFPVGVPFDKPVCKALQKKYGCAPGSRIHPRLFDYLPDHRWMNRDYR
jgi:hypothetical protein